MSERERARRWPVTEPGSIRHVWRKVATEVRKGKTVAWHYECSVCVPTHYRITGKGGLGPYSGTTTEVKSRSGKKPGAE